MSHTAYPLCWPAGWPTTQYRETSRFNTDLSKALNKLKHEIVLMGGKDVVLSSNYTLGASNPKEPGVVAYFTWQGLQMAIPCDRWNKIHDNVQAIALTVEAMRGMERWGAKHMIKAMFTGFKALPSSEKAWWVVLHVPHNAHPDIVKASYRDLAKIHHPDNGGNADAFREVQAAYEQWERRTSP